MSRISRVRGVSRAIPQCNASAMTVDVNGQKITVPIYHVCAIVTQVSLAGLTLSLDTPSRFHERYRRLSRVLRHARETSLSTFVVRDRFSWINIFVCPHSNQSNNVQDYHRSFYQLKRRGLIVGFYRAFAFPGDQSDRHIVLIPMGQTSCFVALEKFRQRTGKARLVPNWESIPSWSIRSDEPSIARGLRRLRECKVIRVKSNEARRGM
ncbi:hypothetical protein G5I_09404 [Acromyrmex echinatior]|uniref:Uncharacterized protein n=1 Tax=Acromyrmex echinatior TaxID=103372 RepID=F4WU49_ACREC|nr:hypothetical protein G5I_09404 [Acromyrmex echinatior]